MPSHTKSPRRSRKPSRRPGVVRRSFALPARLIEEVREAVPPDYGGNANAAVRHALEDYLRRKRDEEFERQMDRMAADPWIRAVNEEIFRETEQLDGEGLPPP